MALLDDCCFFYEIQNNWKIVGMGEKNCIQDKCVALSLFKDRRVRNKIPVVLLFKCSDLP